MRIVTEICGFIELSVLKVVLSRKVSFFMFFSDFPILRFQNTLYRILQSKLFNLCRWPFYSKMNKGVNKIGIFGNVTVSGLESLRL